MHAKGFDGHEFEEHGEKDALPAVGDAFQAARRKDVGIGVKEERKSRIDGEFNINTTPL